MTIDEIFAKIFLINLNNAMFAKNQNEFLTKSRDEMTIKKTRLKTKNFTIDFNIVDDINFLIKVFLNALKINNF